MRFWYSTVKKYCFLFRAGPLKLEHTVIFVRPYPEESIKTTSISESENFKTNQMIFFY